MNKFNVLVFNFNSRKVQPYNIIPYLTECYKRKSKSKRPSTFEEFKEFIIKESKYQWWSRCEYEIVITGFPIQDEREKIDVYYQVMMNLDIITKLLIEEVSNKKEKT